MIKFFRKIRKNLINESRTRKYLIYAGGEIILVVIGILIALQINSYYEFNQSRKSEKEYFNRLLTDLKKDSAYYENRLKETNLLISNYQYFIQQSYKVQNTFEEYKNLMKGIDFPPTEVTTQNATYLELVSTGNLSILQNIQLREDIINMYKNIEQYNKHLRDYDTFSQMILANTNYELKILKYLEFHRNALPFDESIMFRKEDWSYINEPASDDFRLFENLVGMYYHKHQLFLFYLNKLIEEINLLINNIEKELNNVG